MLDVKHHGMNILKIFASCQGMIWNCSLIQILQQAITRQIYLYAFQQFSQVMHHLTKWRFFFCSFILYICICHKAFYDRIKRTIKTTVLQCNRLQSGNKRASWALIHSWNIPTEQSHPDFLPTIQLQREQWHTYAYKYTHTHTYLGTLSRLGLAGARSKFQERRGRNDLS